MKAPLVGWLRPPSSSLPQASTLPLSLSLLPVRCIDTHNFANFSRDKNHSVHTHSHSLLKAGGKDRKRFLFLVSVALSFLLLTYHLRKATNGHPQRRK